MPSHSQTYFEQAAQIARAIDHEAVERIVRALADLRTRGGRLFLLGVGGSAANCAHAVNDFRKLNGIEAYAPTDNVAELTARTHDEGWETVFEAYLRTSRAGERDAIFVLSVGGGDVARNVSVNLVRAVDEAKRRGMKIFGIVGRAESHTKRMGDDVIVIPVPDPAFLTPHAEAFQAVVWHAIVCHPALLLQRNKWEQLQEPRLNANDHE
jgi:D-sedoheptulose 7-phosphate isomerase